MIKVVIVDDEKKSREVLIEILTQYCPDVSIIAEAENCNQGVTVINNAKPDIVLLDIQMPDGIGFNVLERIENPEFEVIFITAFDQYAIKAIKYSALDYILKPVNPTELIKSIEKYRSRVFPNTLSKRLHVLLENMKPEKSQKQKIVLSTSEGYHVINTEDIVRCQSDSYYTNFHLITGKRIIVSKTLKEFEELLGDSGFVRTHKSHLINTRYIKSYIRTDGGYIIMTDGEEIPVSRRKKDYITEIISKM